jgi:MFS transporter, OFA family, oxalate/formate antiporter
MKIDYLAAQRPPVRESKRWGIAAAAVIMQVALGAVYAWSVFRQPLIDKFGWSISQVTLTFTIAIFVLGFAAYFGGLWSNRSGPRIVAMTGGLLYGVGTALACFADHGLLALYLTYGVIGGIGIGLGYIIPIAVLVRWFPDKRGLMTGIAVGGFGAGALITAPLATRLITSVGVLNTFLYLGIAYLIVCVICGFFMENPPEGYRPAGWEPSPVLKKSTAAGDFKLHDALATWQWWALWLLLFLNTSAGISIISQEAPMFHTLAGVSKIVAAGMVGIASFGNGAGRIFWAWISDLIPRRFVFLIMFLLQTVLFWILPNIHTQGMLTVAAFIILLCYGGGFGTMPAFAADYFGPKYVGQVYGLMLTAWGFASAFGPLLIAHTLQSTGHYETGLHILAIVLLVSAILPFIVRPPRLPPDVAVGSGTGGIAIAH